MSERDDRDQKQHESAWDDLPYPAVPAFTRRGLEHVVVAIDGVFWTGPQRIGQRVVGRTACGKSDLMMDRDAAGFFPKCRRCYRPTPQPDATPAPVGETSESEDQ